VHEVVKRLFRKEPHQGVNPDEVVALGAAVQAGVLAGDVKDILLLDVTPLSLGIETLGGVMTTLIARNTTIPTRKSEVFTTAADGQTSVEIHVLQGERPMARDNRTLGRFHLVGIAPAPRGVPQVEVTFDIDANGILHVSARDQGTGKEQAITITASTGLTKDEIDRMVKEAESHAAEDERRKEEIELRNKLDADVYSTEKLLSENRDKLASGDIQPVEEALKEAKSALEEGKAERIKAAADQLQKASFRLGELMYQRTQQTPPSGDGEAPTSGATTGGQERSGRDDVVDAEFEETDKSDRR
jgi:molecular chaperone DnaK